MSPLGEGLAGDTVMGAAVLRGWAAWGLSPPNLPHLPQLRVGLILHAGEAEEEWKGGAGGEAVAEPGGEEQHRHPAGAPCAHQVGFAPCRGHVPAPQPSPPTSPAQPCPPTPGALARVRWHKGHLCAQLGLQAAPQLIPTCCFLPDPKPATPPSARTQSRLRWPQAGRETRPRR